MLHYRFLLYIAIIIINCKWVYTWWQCAALQDRTIQYSTIQYNITSHKITHNTQGNPQYSKLQKNKNQECVLYTIKIHKRVVPTVDELVLKSTRYTKQSVNHTIQYSVTHIFLTLSLKVHHNLQGESPLVPANGTEKHL